jgi:hypothetical protein
MIRFAIETLVEIFALVLFLASIYAIAIGVN